jgi:hypothetical protein
VLVQRRVLITNRDDDASRVRRLVRIAPEQHLHHGDVVPIGRHPQRVLALTVRGPQRRAAVQENSRELEIATQHRDHQGGETLVLREIEAGIPTGHELHELLGDGRRHLRIDVDARVQQRRRDVDTAERHGERQHRLPFPRQHRGVGAVPEQQRHRVPRTRAHGLLERRAIAVARIRTRLAQGASRRLVVARDHDRERRWRVAACQDGIAAEHGQGPGHEQWGGSSVSAHRHTVAIDGPGRSFKRASRRPQAAAGAARALIAGRSAIAIAR